MDGKNPPRSASRFGGTTRCGEGVLTAFGLDGFTGRSRAGRLVLFLFAALFLAAPLCAPRPALAVDPASRYTKDKIKIGRAHV